MANWWKVPIRLSLIVSAIAILVADTAFADPIRLSVQFTVAGATGSRSIADPDFGSTVASGSFSLLTEVPFGEGFQIVQNTQSGLGADQLSLSFADTSWTTANADVGFLVFLDGRLVHWFLGGFFDGLCCETVHPAPFPPDIGINSIVNAPGDFGYTTPRSATLGIFSGTVSTVSVTTESVAATPEPTSLLLCASGLAGVVARRAKGHCRRRRHRLFR